MPLLKLEYPENAVWGLWEATEDDDFFLRQLPEGYLAGYEPQRFTERRRREFLASRWLLRQLLNDDSIVLVQDANGKMKERSGKVRFSLSHSGRWVAAMASTSRQVGIDVEEIHPRVKKVMHKFLSAQEKEVLGENPELWWITLCWSAKESLFKMLQTQGVSFSNDLILHLPQAGEGKFTADVQRNGQWKKVEMEFEKSEEYVVTRVCSW